ncbi:MAG: TolC family protein [Pirellulaceae bacterium]
MKNITAFCIVSCSVGIVGCTGLRQSEPPEAPASSAALERIYQGASNAGNVNSVVQPVAFFDEQADGEKEKKTQPERQQISLAAPLDGLAPQAGEVRKQRDDANSNANAVSIEPSVVFNASAIPTDAEVYSAEVAYYSLADIEGLALANNPAIQSAHATANKAAGLYTQVGKRPNPTLGYFGQQLADEGTDQHGVFVEQEFVRGNKLQLNRDVLRHTQRAQFGEAETQRYRVLTDVRVRFFEAIAAQLQVDATRAFAEVAKRGVDVAEARQEAEEGTLVETLQARTLLSEVMLAAEQAEVAYHGAWQDLAAIAGLRQTTNVRLVADLDAPIAAPDWRYALDATLSQSPELATARAIVSEKRALLCRQQAQPIPNIAAQLGAGYDNGTDNGMINVQLSAPIPVWNRNTGNISAAYSSYVRATQEVQRIEQSIRSRLARASQEFDSAMRAVRKYQDEIIPQAAKSLELSEEAYRAGELDFLQVLIVRRNYYESTIRLIQAKGNLAQAKSKVDGLLLTGGLESPTDYTDGDGIRGASFGGQ